MVKFAIRAAQICALTLCIAGFGHSAVAHATIITFDPPGSVATYPDSANTLAAITGYFEDDRGSTHGFLRTADGTITSFDASEITGYATVATGINNNDAITGLVQIAKHLYQGFIRSPDGTITTFSPGHSTWPTAINDKGVIAGYYYLDKKWRGFVRNADGTLKSFQPSGSTDTYPSAINNAGVITGYFLGSSSPASIGPFGTRLSPAEPRAPAATMRHTYHGFFRANGVITTFDPPGSIETITGGINKGGVIVGYYKSAKSIRGFRRTLDGTITSVDVPKSVGTFAFDIDNEGVVTGEYVNKNNVFCGFVMALDGKFKTFDAMGSTDTEPTAIAAGMVTGVYGSGNTSHGFLRTK